MWASEPKQDESIQTETEPGVGIQNTNTMRRASSQRGSPQCEADPNRIRRVSTLGAAGGGAVDRVQGEECIHAGGRGKGGSRDEKSCDVILEFRTSV